MSERDIDALRLLCWCQYIMPEQLSAFLSEAECTNLIRLGLMKQHQASGAMILTGAGSSFLKDLYGSAVPQQSFSYHKFIIQRRLRVSKIALTAYRAGVDVFTTTPEELQNSPSLFLSALTRSRGSNPWGSTRVAALARLNDLLCAVHYVCPGIGRLSLTDELTAFTNQTVRFSNVTRALMFAGESYQDVLAELEESGPEGDAKLTTYGDAYRRVQLPIHLLSCDDVGAMQLKLMATPDYRARLTRAALKAQYVPPPKDVPVWDALFRGLPFVMAADMDLRRIDAALEAARNRGLKQIAVAALEGQAEAVLFPRYRDTGKARVFILTPEALAEALDGPPALYAPSRQAYKTEKGDVVDAPLIQAAGKAGKTAGKAGGHHR